MVHLRQQQLLCLSNEMSLLKYHIDCVPEFESDVSDPPAQYERVFIAWAGMHQVERQGLRI